MNFVEKLLANGFTRIVYDWEKKKGRYDGEFNPKNGWLGLTIYHPYEMFEKEGITVELDLTRYGVKDFIGGQLVNVNEKRIVVKRDGLITYENKMGILPHDL